MSIYDIQVGESHPLVARLSARIQFLGKVSQVVIIMEVKKRNQLLILVRQTQNTVKLCKTLLVSSVTGVCVCVCT